MRPSRLQLLAEDLVPLRTHFERRYRVSPEGEHWEWTGPRRLGLAIFQCRVPRLHQRIDRSARQVSWLLYRTGADGRQVVATCGSEWCVNPCHLERQTEAQATCRRGHALTPDNVARSGPWRRCRTCLRALQRRLYRAKVEKAKQQQEAA